MLVFGIALLALPALGLAETVRVATWNLESNKGEYVLEAGATNQATEALKEFLPDVIILQGASGWKGCAQVIKSLQPEPYRVTICSALQAGTSGAGTHREVAILTRHSTYSCWWKPWDAGQTGSSGAFAFAAVQLGKKNLGVFSADLGAWEQGTTASALLLGQIETVKGWTHNEVDTFIVGGCCRGRGGGEAPLPGLGGRDFIDACLGLVSRPANPAYPFLYVDANGFPARPRILRAPGPNDTLVLTEVELEPAVVAAARIAHAQERARIILDTAKRAQEADGLSAAMQVRSASSAVAHIWWAVGGLGVVVLGLIITLWRMVRPKRLTFPQSTALLPGLEGETGQSSSITVVLSPRSVTASTAEATGAPHSGPIVRIDSEAPTQTHSASWQQRAIAAEQEAARAQQIIQQGLIPQLRRWLQQKLVRKLMADRAEMLTAQRSATQKAHVVNDVLAKIEHQVQQQNRQYERRIEELTLELLATREENRELIRCRISQVRAEMEAAAARLRAQAEQ